MLRNLYIRDFVIVDQLELNLTSGFTVFSGETGAGKSILIDALTLALGGRTDTNVIRDGATKTDISATFDIPEKLQIWLQEQSIDGSEIILRRVIDNTGRSKAYINGIPSTLTQIRELAQQLIDIHGQHAHQSLLNLHSQRAILDTQAGLGQKLKQLQLHWDNWHQAKADLLAAQNNAQDQAARKQRLENDIEYLEKIGCNPDEWPDLCARQARLAHGQALLQSTNQAAEILYGENDSVTQALNAAIHSLQTAAKHDKALDEFIESLESASIICSETASSINAYASKIELDPNLLNQLEQRMAVMFEAARRFNTEPENLSAVLDQLNAELANLNTKTNIQELERACASFKQQYFDLAVQISQTRQTQAQSLSHQITQAMQTLAMEGGAFAIQIDEQKPSQYGIDHIEFLVAGHAGTKPKPLSKVASGGELARISLAISVIASQAARVPTLIFDEVDVGIGGAVAEVVGKLLQKLALQYQVLCVTHLPQVAACANQHYQVSKQTRGQSTLSHIIELDQNTRVEEIARMLGGLNITTTTRKHASEMLGKSI